MKKSNFYDAVWERLVALKSYKLISIRNKTFRLTKRGMEFLKHENKEYYLGKILFTDKYKRTKHPDIFIECFNQLVEMSSRKIKAIRKIVFSGIDYDFDEISEDEWSIWNNFIEKVYCRLGKRKSKKLIGKVCESSFRNIIVGTKALIDIQLGTLKKILKEHKEIKTAVTKEKLKETKNENSFIVKNLLELHVEEIVRRNFEKLFPDLQIIDNS